MRLRWTPSEGATIMELMVSFSIMIVLIVLASQLFISSWRRFHQSNALQVVNSNAAAAVDRLSKDFRETCREDIILKDDQYILFRSPRSLKGIYQRDSEYKPDWVSWILYYRASQNTSSGDVPVLARRIIQTNAVLSNIESLYASNIDSGNIAGKETKVTIAAHNIKSFRIVKTDTPDGVPVYAFTVETEMVYQKNVYSTALCRSLTPLLSKGD
ncbi:MAG: PilW family protein [Vulcanimicrobiota bacterium]